MTHTHGRAYNGVWTHYKGDRTRKRQLESGKNHCGVYVIWDFFRTSASLCLCLLLHLMSSSLAVIVAIVVLSHVDGRKLLWNKFQYNKKQPKTPNTQIVLDSLLQMLSILITLRNIYFLHT